MTTDSIELLALNRAIHLSADVEVQIKSMQKTSEPLQVILHKAREDAAAALNLLATANADNPSEIRKLQNEVRRFDDLVQWLRDMYISGFIAQQQLSEQQRNEVSSLILDEDDMAMLGISNQGEHDD